MANRGYKNPTDGLREVYQYLKGLEKWHVSVSGYEYRNINVPYILLSVDGGECMVGDGIPLDKFDVDIKIEIFDKAGEELQILDLVDDLYNDIKKMKREHVLPPCNVTFSHIGVQNDVDGWQFLIHVVG